MKLSDVTKDFTQYVYEKAGNPFFWIFTVCFITTHWDDFLVLLFSEDEINNKILYIKSSIASSNLFSITSPYFYLLKPLFSALLVTTLYPVLTTFSSFCYDGSLAFRNKIACYFDKEKFLSIQESIELKDSRVELINMFNKQLQENQKQLRESQQQFIKAQANSAAMFCALGFGKGMESLLPNSELFGSFIAKNTQEKELIEIIKVLNASHQNAELSNVDSLHKYLEKNSIYQTHSLRGISLSELRILVHTLCDSGALIPSYRKFSPDRNSVEYDTPLQLSQAGVRFAETLEQLKHQSFSVSDSVVPS